MSSGALLGLDIGTTKVKGAIFAPGRGVVASADHPHATARARSGWSEQDASAWQRAVAAVLAELGRRADLAAVGSVGICSQVNTHLFVDAHGDPLAPAITWQDGRCGDVAAELDERLDDATRRRIWGEPYNVDASYLVARAVWMERERPDVWERTRWVLSPKDYVNLWLTGEPASDPISSIGLTDGHEYLSRLDELMPGVAERLPALRDPADVVGRVRAGRLGLPAVPVAAGTMDAWANLVGSGVAGPGEGMHVAGTSEILGVLSDRGVGAPGVVTFPERDGLRLHAGPTQAGGDALRWAAEAWDRPIDEVLGSAALAPAGSAGALFLPHLAGERAPLWDSRLRGAFAGLGFEHGREQLCRAVLEGVAFSARQLLEAIVQAAGIAPPELVLSGGGAASDLWCQIKADVFGTPLRRCAILDTGVLGAAVLGGAAAGRLDRVDRGAEDFAGHDRVFEPDLGHRERYDDGYARYRAVQTALRGALAPGASDPGTPS